MGFVTRAEADMNSDETERLRRLMAGMDQTIAKQAREISELTEQYRELTENYTEIQASNEKNWSEARDRIKEIEILKEQLEIKSTALKDVESFRARENKEMSIRLDTLLTVISVAFKGKGGA